MCRTKIFAHSFHFALSCGSLVRCLLFNQNRKIALVSAEMQRHTTHQYCHQKLNLQWQTKHFGTKENQFVGYRLPRLCVMCVRFGFDKFTLKDIIMDSALQHSVISTGPMNNLQICVYTKRSRGSGTSWLDIQINKLVSIEVILNSSSDCQLSSREIETERGREYSQIYPQNQFTRYHSEESSIENLPIKFSFFSSLLVCVCMNNEHESMHMRTRQMCKLLN